MLRRIAATSASGCGLSTKARHWRGRGIGHSLMSRRDSAFPDWVRQALPYRQPAASSQSAARTGFLSEMTRCQEPLFSGLGGLPRGRSVISRPSCLATRAIHFASPNGEPRATLRRNAAKSASDCGFCSWLRHKRGRGTGQSLKTCVANSSRCVRWYRLDQAHSAARVQRLARGIKGVRNLFIDSGCYLS